MPDDIRLLLAGDDFQDPRQLAARADVLWQAKQQGETTISTVAATTRRVTRTTERPVNATNKDKWSYYHQRWGSEARRCRPPCTHSGNALAGRQ